jgi:hypothetical protein
MTMRCLAFAVLLAARSVAADPSYRLVEDGALGIELPTDHVLLGNVDPALTACANGKVAAEGSAVYWLELARSGKATAVHVHGAGKLDDCLERALGKAVAADKLPGAVVVVGHLDLMEPTSSNLMPSPRINATPVMIDRHNTRWQVTVTRVAYTANRAADIALALDAASNAIADCASKRTAPGRAVAWSAGHPIVRSGAAGYDACLAAALAFKLPAPESALWLELEIAPPAEAFAPRTDDERLSHERALRDALTTAVRARKLDLGDCLVGHKGATLTKLTVALRAEKARVTSVSTGNADADACITGKLVDVKIPNALPADTLELEVELP